MKKSLTEIGWEKYFLARTKGHILYLEGSTDLQMLQTFAFKLKHKVALLLLKVNAQYTSDNVPNTAVSNFTSLQAIFPELKGLALFDRLENFTSNPKLNIICWKKREIENYFARPVILQKHAKLIGGKYPNANNGTTLIKMEKVIEKYTIPAYLHNINDPWWDNAKLTDDWLDIIFREFYKEMSLPQDFFKRDYYQLIHLLDPHEIDQEIVEKLDAIYELIK
jgi:hypothetical protein